MPKEKVAKVHTQTSLRARPRDNTERKVVFKGVLDNPHRVPWPSVPPNVQNSILAHLVGILDGIADYQRARCLRARARKKDSATTNDTLTDLDTAAWSEPPPIFKSLIFGINAVTKYLETQIANCRLKTVFQSSTKDMEQASEEHDTIRYLFVCRADIDPPILIDHLPHLVATYNVLRGSDVPPTILIPLPKGAETTLAQAVGVRRLAVLAIDKKFDVGNERLALANAVPIVTAPWLSSHPARTFVQTHIKQLRTTAPKDMKAAKTARLLARSAAKARRSSEKAACS
ncbi:hypothetical protein Agabi119p4_265 [Agaricus bisporus var. burnettii]|uniref:Uncharacterized protein n=1 Tax=Agaricus bisporus var. burnettii TaxID=192524 RepID=A0A8H7FAG9_AGABI|nr:hypothetical protein Agabi119p4_265 [Agaricus bisporus var. burnettii]